MELAPDDLIYIRTMVKDRSAIFLEDEKDYLIHSRLDPLAKELGFVSSGGICGQASGFSFRPHAQESRGSHDDE